MLTVYRVDWTEYERGWGQRPDGYTLYKDKESMDRHIKEYSAKYLSDKIVPDYYSKPGTGRIVEVPQAIYDVVQESKDGYEWDHNFKYLI